MSEKSYPRMHTSLYVSDLQKTMDFYTAFFGQEPTKVKEAYVKYEVEEPGLTISFLEQADRVQSNFGHMGIQVDSLKELGERHAHIKSKGLKTLEEEGTACCYAVQDKFWVSDPDGHRWEIYFFHKDSEWNDPEYSSFTTKVIPAQQNPEKEACC